LGQILTHLVAVVYGWYKPVTVRVLAYAIITSHI
jgi:hypothetical protein